ncbi:MAG: hypothetical protein HYZ29_31340 [Myxococcales bacterium]|nr:hypothetical protein [Myxococcales bacterium]
MTRAAIVAAALFAGCGAPAEPASPPPHVAAPPSSIAADPAPTSTPTASPVVAVRGPEPKGPASLALHVERGKRQPLSLVGTLDAIRAPIGDQGLDAWTELTLSVAGKPEKLYVQSSPPGLTLPFEVGARLSVEIDCRRGGWHRVCDGVFRDAARRTLMIVAGSGDDGAAPGWKVGRGAVTTSEVRPSKEKSVRHTHALALESEGARVSVMPHEWKRVLVHGRSFLVTGYEVVWEGERPPDARDHRSFAIVFEKPSAGP